MTAKRLLEQALQLRSPERFLLLEGLLESLDHPDQTCDAIWAEEAEKRLTAYRDGRVKSHSYEEVFGETHA